MHKIQNVKLEDMKENDGFDDLRVNKTISKSYRKGLEYVGWFHLALNKVQWQVLVNMVMNLQSHKRWGIF
jgi:hypothetical protein